MDFFALGLAAYQQKAPPEVEVPHARPQRDLFQFPRCRTGEEMLFIYKV